MATLLHPPIYSPSLKCRLTTVDEAIDYIDTRLPESDQNHRLVQAARNELYRAQADSRRPESSHKLAQALPHGDMNLASAALSRTLPTSKRLSSRSTLVRLRPTLSIACRMSCSLALVTCLK